MAAGRAAGGKRQRVTSKQYDPSARVFGWRPSRKSFVNRIVDPVLKHAEQSRQKRLADDHHRGWNEQPLQLKYVFSVACQGVAKMHTYVPAGTVSLADAPAAFAPKRWMDESVHF